MKERTARAQTPRRDGRVRRAVRVGRTPGVGRSRHQMVRQMPPRGRQGWVTQKTL